MLPAPTIEILQDRAKMLQKARSFFSKRKILEMDCCALSPYAAIDANIDVISSTVTEKDIGYLHTSPEYALKRLLSAGHEDIYYLGHVFRKNDLGHIHNPEFTMAEWYRLNFSFEEMIQETCEFLFLFFKNLPIRTLTYRQAFETHLNFNPFKVSTSHLRTLAKEIAECDPLLWNRDACMHFLLTHAIEPKLGIDELTVLTHYPPHEAALAKVTHKNDDLVAERFEIYYQGIELANGYHELGDAKELRRRFEHENTLRHAHGKETYSLDEIFLTALQTHFPPCCGVSVGFDRALMLRHKSKTIHEVLPFAWTAPQRLPTIN
ncbi:MAG: EF-P lysine aminoacylase GenX [Chlamydiae bacterium]|nr:EF-P lysine aminoacylase GenX [Chlamydiota bacterium]